MKKITSFLICLFIISSAANLSAMGLGFFGSLQRTSGTYERDTGELKTKTDMDIERNGIGFILETTTAYNRMFGYRMELGYFYDYKQKYASGGSEKLTYLNLDNTFSFGIIRTSLLRFWLGPVLSAGTGDAKDKDWDYTDYELGIGFSAGINLHVSKLISISAAAGVRYSFLTGREGDSSSYSSDKVLYSGTFSGYHATIAILFRIAGDQYTW